MNYFNIGLYDREFLVEWKGHRIIVYMRCDAFTLDIISVLKDIVATDSAWIEISDSIIAPILDEDKAREYATEVIDKLEQCIQDGKPFED
jgi:hypothetical protein